MLLRNESRLKHVVQIKLVFDDNTKRELEIHEGDCVQISYRKNGCCREGIGIIRKINPYIISKKFCSCMKERYESAVLKVDMSEENQCHVEEVDLFDIIDIQIKEDEPENICPGFIKHCCCMKNQEEEPKTEEPDSEETEKEEEVVEND